MSVYIFTTSSVVKCSSSCFVVIQIRSQTALIWTGWSWLFEWNILCCSTPSLPKLLHSATCAVSLLFVCVLKLFCQIVPDFNCFRQWRCGLRDPCTSHQRHNWPWQWGGYSMLQQWCRKTLYEMVSTIFLYMQAGQPWHLKFRHEELVKICMHHLSMTKDKLDMVILTIWASWWHFLYFFIADQWHTTQSIVSKLKGRRYGASTGWMERRSDTMCESTYMM